MSGISTQGTSHIHILSETQKEKHIERVFIERACLVEGFNTLATAGKLNLVDKRVDPGCWLRSGFESPRRQLGF